MLSKKKLLCGICTETKPATLFTAAFKGKHRICKNCKTHLNRFNRFGISPKQYQELLQKQAHKCAICEKELTFIKNSAVVDHCHGSNKIRGILCRNCNTGLGVFKDNKAFLAKAIYYLENPIAKNIQQLENQTSGYTILREFYKEKPPGIATEGKNHKRSADG